MNWHASPQRLGSLLREMPQTVHRPRGAAAATGAAQTVGYEGASVGVDVDLGAGAGAGAVVASVECIG